MVFVLNSFSLSSNILTSRGNVNLYPQKIFLVQEEPGLECREIILAYDLEKA